MRNHADVSATDQEFYRWGLVAAAAREAIKVRYRLLDYLYTGLYYASKTGEAVVKPLWFLWPGDENTYKVETQFMLGDGLLVNPVVEDDSQSVSFYLPQGIWYDFWSHKRVDQRDKGEWVTVEGVGWGDIPVYIRGGSILPLRISDSDFAGLPPSQGGGQAMTTKEVRNRNFELVVAPDADGKAKGRLYLDDGESLDSGGRESEIGFSWDGKRLEAKGMFGYDTGVKVVRVVVLGDGEVGERKVEGEWELTGSFTVEF